LEKIVTAETLNVGIAGRAMTIVADGIWQTLFHRAF
jgi:hypothetical protein